MLFSKRQHNPTVLVEFQRNGTEYRIVQGPVDSHDYSYDLHLERKFKDAMQSESWTNVETWHSIGSNRSESRQEDDYELRYALGALVDHLARVAAELAERTRPIIGDDDRATPPTTGF